jgi:hypothetical protein
MPNDLADRTKRLLTDDAAVSGSTGGRKSSTRILGRLRAAAVVGALVVAAAASVGAVGYGAFQARRWINWNLGYQDDVQKEICKAVKPEYLKDEYAAKCGR